MEDALRSEMLYCSRVIIKNYIQCIYAKRLSLTILQLSSCEYLRVEDHWRSILSIKPVLATVMFGFWLTIEEEKFKFKTKSKYLENE